jgi:Na+/H+ antiporter NhaD/arsenite permease-like protein
MLRKPQPPSRAASLPETREIAFLFVMCGIATSGMALGGFFERPYLGVALALAALAVAFIVVVLRPSVQ